MWQALAQAMDTHYIRSSSQHREIFISFYRLGQVRCSRSGRQVWEPAKARLGFSLESTDPHRAAGWAAGREVEETASVLKPQGLGTGGLEQGRGQEMLQGASSPCPAWPWRLALLCPHPSMGCPASLLSLSWGSGGRGRKLASCLWLPEERTRKEAVGTDHQVLGDSPWPLWGCLSTPFLVLDNWAG